MSGADGSGSKAGLRAAIALSVFLALVVLLFVLDPDGFVLWAKAAHVIAIIAWMAAMLYLPRLFVYHATLSPGSEGSELLKVMERRLLKAIMTPAMIVSWVFGLYLAWEIHGFSGGWLHAKILLVFMLSGVHGYLAGAVRRFSADERGTSDRHWRVVNEVPTVLMILIVILVIVRPF